MNPTQLFRGQLSWLNLPGALLLALLQRSPAMQFATTAAEFVAAPPVGAVLRSAMLTAASLGAIHSLAGATTLSTNNHPTPLAVTAGTAVPTVVFGVIGAQGLPGSWKIGGSIPPGLSFSGLTSPGTVNTAALALTGTPTVAGSYSVTLQAWENTNAKGNGSPIFSYVINVAAGGTSTSAPVFTTQPASQTVNAGATVTFTVTASGSPAPAYQWSFNGTAISGASSATLTLPSVQATAAGSYKVSATNSVGTATSNTATLVVNAVVPPPIFTTQPASQTVTAGATVTFIAAASGLPAPIYQWSLNGTTIAGATNATLTLSNVQATATGSYTVVATNSTGTVMSNAAVLVVNVPSGPPPAFTTQPVSQTMPLGSTVVFSAVASNSPSLQWTFNGTAMANATNAMLVLTHLAPANAGTYTCVATNAGGSTTSSAATLTVGDFTAADIGHLVNVSILTTAGAGAKALTVGAVIGPLGFTSSLPLVVRAVGPTLNSAFGLPGVLADPVLTVNASSNSKPIATNDNWGGGPGMTAAFKAVGAFALPAASLDSAYISLSGLAPGGYTVQVTGNNDASGLVIAEIYDAGDATRTAATPRLINLSTLTAIDAGSSLAAGFVLRGQTSRTLIVRGIGPSLSALGVPGVMADPKLEFFNNDTGMKIAESDDWGGDSQLTATMASVGAFPLSSPASKDAVLLITLPPGAYSARVSDITGGAGTAIVEIYEVP